MDSQIKMIAADLDGTLLNHNSQLTDFSGGVLRACHEKGILVIFATGRAFFTIPEAIRTFPYADYVIASNGAAIHACGSGMCLARSVLPEESAKRLITFALEHRLGLECISGGRAYGERYYFEHPENFAFDRRSMEYLHNTRIKIEDLEAFTDAHIASIESIDFVLPNLCQKETIEQHFAADKGLYFTSSHERILEFSAAGCGKANALRTLLKRTSISADALIAFGNASNDVEMLQLSRHGVATANAPEEVRALADAVCGSCYEDGVARYLQTLLALSEITIEM